MKLSQPISLIIVALLASVLVLAAPDTAPAVTYQGDWFTYDADSGEVEIYRDGDAMDLDGRAALVFVDGQLANGKAYPELDTLPQQVAIAYLIRIVEWQPMYMLGGWRITGAANPVRNEDLVIVFNTNGRKYEAPPLELQREFDATPTPERPSNGGGMS